MVARYEVSSGEAVGIGDDRAGAQPRGLVQMTLIRPHTTIPAVLAMSVYTSESADTAGQHERSSRRTALSGENPLMEQAVVASDGAASGRRVRAVWAATACIVVLVAFSGYLTV
jgi:hypothetical protein